VSFQFDNQKQKEAAKYILARSAIKPRPNKRQLAVLIESKSNYDTLESARKFVKNFVGHSSTPLEEKGFEIIRKDIRPVSNKEEVSF